MSKPEQRRVARAIRPGGPEVIEIGVEDLEPPQPDQAVVRVEAAGLNHAETLIRRGNYVVRLPFPHAIGGEGSGTILERGSRVSLAVGARVCWAGVLGSCATHVIVPASMLVPIPDTLSFESAASLAVAGLTAGGLVRVWPLQGRTAVVWGAAGAVGRMLVAMLAERDVRVIGIASGNRVEEIRAAGAACVIDRTTEEVQESVLRYTDESGASAVFDPIGGSTFALSLQLLAPRGCLISYGELSGPVRDFDLRQLFSRSAFVTKYNGTRWVEGLHEFAGLVSDALALAARRPAVVAPVAGRFPLDRVADAYRALESGARGKVLVVPIQH